MADSDDDYENTMMNYTTKRNGSQNGRNKFKKEREEYSNGDSMKNSYHDKSHYNNNNNNNKRSDRSFTPPLSRYFFLFLKNQIKKINNYYKK
jgi:hypothetical protein